MTVKDARIILVCENMLDLFYAQSKGAFSAEMQAFFEVMDEVDEALDLNDLKKEAVPIILKELDRLTEEINKRDVNEN